MDKEKLQIDLNLMEDDDIPLKLKDMPRRKSSTGSTSVSKPEEPSDFSFPSTPCNIPQESQQSGIFFGRDRNCSNPIFNFYQHTEEHIRDTLTEYKNYTKSKNYITKNEFFKNNENTSENKIMNDSFQNTIDNLSQNNNTFKNSLPTTSVAAVMGAFTPKICSGGKGKFDLPMYYVGFYGWDSTNGMPMIPFNPKDFNQKDEKNEKSSPAEGNDDNSKKENKSENSEKKPENFEPTMMIGTPIFFSNMPKYCYNKLYKRKQKPFTEREGDWICKCCKNLNFAFRVECNRCKLPKGADSKTNNEENKNTNKEYVQEQKPYQRSQRYNKHKKNHNYYYNKNNENENGKE